MVVRRVCQMKQEFFFINSIKRGAKLSQLAIGFLKTH